MTIQESEKQHQQHLNQLKEKLKKNNITPASLRAMKQQNKESRDLTPLTETEMEDIILSLSLETEQQANEIEDLKRQLEEQKTMVQTLQQQFQIIKEIANNQLSQLQVI